VLSWTGWPTNGSPERDDAALNGSEAIPETGVMFAYPGVVNCGGPHSGDARGEVQAEDGKVGHGVVLDKDEGVDIGALEGLCAGHEDP
jgi:hypothetical protein